MSRKAITVWKESLKGASVPDCPADLSEPFWANLIFGERMCEVRFH
jgi:hypothetical protein